MRSPLESPMMRYGIDLSRAVVLVALGLLAVDGPLRYLAFGTAVLDAASETTLPFHDELRRT